MIHLGLGIQAAQAHAFRSGPFFPGHGLERIVEFHERQDRRYARAAREASERHGKPVLSATELTYTDRAYGNPGPSASARKGGSAIPARTARSRRSARCCSYAEFSYSSREQVGVLLEPLQVALAEARRLLDGDLAAAQGGFRGLADLLDQVLAVVLDVVEHVLDGLALDHVVDVVAAVLVHAHVHGVGVAEQVVEVAEDLLVGAHQEDAEVVRLAVQGMQLEHVLDVVLVDELIRWCRRCRR